MYNRYTHLRWRALKYKNPLRIYYSLQYHLVAALNTCTRLSGNIAYGNMCTIDHSPMMLLHYFHPPLCIPAMIDFLRSSTDLLALQAGELGPRHIGHPTTFNIMFFVHITHVWNRRIPRAGSPQALCKVGGFSSIRQCNTAIRDLRHKLQWKKINAAWHARKEKSCIPFGYTVKWWN